MCAYKIIFYYVSDLLSAIWHNIISCLKHSWENKIRRVVFCVWWLWVDGVNWLFPIASINCLLVCSVWWWWFVGQPAHLYDQPEFDFHFSPNELAHHVLFIKAMNLIDVWSKYVGFREHFLFKILFPLLSPCCHQPYTLNLMLFISSAPNIILACFFEFINGRTGFAFEIHLKFRISKWDKVGWF